MYSNIKYPQRSRSENGEIQYDEACRAFFNWKDAVAESAEEYSERIRKLKLLGIVRSIIENELTKEQRDMLRLHYLENKNGEEIAAMYGVSRSTVCRNLTKITDVFRLRMKYVFEYADSDIRDEAVPAYIEQALSVMAFHSAKPESMGDRLRKARQKKLLTTSLVSELTGVAQKRIESFEQGGVLNTDEFVKLISFYKISADQAVFGV
ncbi:MAG: sigma factor-like helix-turn-helix DNA-binding protein [Acutalibacteraceae bacterium]